MDPYLAANRANWDDRVRVHMLSSFYDVEGWFATRRLPRPREVDALGALGGLDVVHLQCHFGLDTLALANAGACVTGIDFSPNAIAQAQALAVRAGLTDRARFVEADVLGAAEALAPNTYDIVYVSLGALCWLPSITRWADQVGRLMRPGARLYVHDVHPLAWALAEDDLRVERSYFEEHEPVVDDAGTTYTDDDVPIASARSYEWNHSIGEIITALLAQGLRLDRLTEHDWTLWRRFPWLEETADHRWRMPPGRPRIPLSFTILASLPLATQGPLTAVAHSTRSLRSSISQA